MLNDKNVRDLVENDVLADGRVVSDVEVQYWIVDGRWFAFAVTVTFDDGSVESYLPFKQVPMAGTEFLAPN